MMPLSGQSNLARRSLLRSCILFALRLKTFPKRLPAGSGAGSEGRISTMDSLHGRESTGLPTPGLLSPPSLPFSFFSFYSPSYYLFSPPPASQRASPCVPALQACFLLLYVKKTGSRHDHLFVLFLIFESQTTCYQRAL
jgi:hypothetical protein